MIRGVFAEDNVEYVNHQKKIREIIASLTLENALRGGLDRREFYRLKMKLKSDKKITLRKKILEKLFLFLILIPSIKLWLLIELISNSLMVLIRIL